MKLRLAVLFLFWMLQPSAQGLELVCRGQAQQNSGQRVVEVECANRKLVVDILEKAWVTLRTEGIGGSMEDLCWSAFNKAKEIHPSIDMKGVAPILFMQCNTALQYIK